MAVRAIRSQSRKNGLDKMSNKDIHTLIKKTRTDRKR
jgi:hypothetical protein